MTNKIDNKKIKMGLGQIKIVPGQPQENLKKILEFVKKAKENKCDVVLFPEMAIPGYMLSDLWEDTAFVKECDLLKKEIFEASNGISIVVGNVALDDRVSLFNSERTAYGNDGRTKKYNAAIVATNGSAANTTGSILKFNNQSILPYGGIAIKTNLPLYRQFEDQRHFVPLKELAQQTGLQLENFLQPFELTATKNKFNAGVLICEDVWVNDYVYKGQTLNPAKFLAQNGAEILLVLSTSPYGWRKQKARERNLWKVQKDLFEIGKPLPIVYLNAVGFQNNGKNEYGMDGRSAIYDGFGKKIFEAPAWEEELYCVDVLLPPYNLDGKTVEYYYKSPNKFEEREELKTALIQGIKEFCEQKGVENIIIGLSGGIDSALVAYLSAQAIGPEHVFCVNLPTKFNSNWTKDVAKTVAENIGAPYQIVPIEDLTNAVREKVANVNFKNDYGIYGPTNKDRVVDENIQARIRIADIVSGIAAKYPKTIYTCNGNKSEILFGWFTLDGDGRGALCPIGDLYKTQIIDLCAHINELEIKTKGKVIFPWELIAPVFEPLRYYDNWDGKTTPLPKGVKKLVPSAELSENQNVDEGKGDPIIFNYHDLLLRRFVEYRENPEDILRAYVEGGFDGLVKQLWVDPAFLKNLLITNFGTKDKWIEDLEKIWKLFHIAVFKQIQSPPIISVSKRPLGFDFRRSQLKSYLTKEYFRLKNGLLIKKGFE